VIFVLLITLAIKIAEHTSLLNGASTWWLTSGGNFISLTLLALLAYRDTPIFGLVLLRR
jgi:hypothetical protein